MRAPSISPGKLRYAPIPVRALADLRLAARHLRTLGVIAAFDRLGKNGSGCWTSQNKIADILGVDKTRLSHNLSDLRDYGYITSEINPDRRSFRVHRVIYTDADFDCLGKGKTVAQYGNCPEQQQLPNTATDSCPTGQQQLRTPIEKDSNVNGLQNVTIVPITINREEEAKVSSEEGQNCAEARIRSLSVSEAEAYLTNCENEPVESLAFECKAIERLANDPCLPEALNERAAKLLCQISP